jgi:hypothetical protein
MSARLANLVARREALVRKSRAQREHLATEAAALQSSLWFVEPAVRGALFATSRPVLLAVAAAGMLALGPRRLFSRGSRFAVVLLSAWRLGSSLRSLTRD